MHDIIVFSIIIAVLAVLPLTLWNIYAFITFLLWGSDTKAARITELTAVAVGVFDFYAYSLMLAEPAEWWVQLQNNQVHSFVSLQRLPTLYILLAAAVLGYILLRFIPAKKLPPLLTALGIGGVYIGIALCIVLCVQIGWDIWIFTFAFNCILLFTKSVCMVVKQKYAEMQSTKTSVKLKSLSKFLTNWAGLPLLGFLALLPLMGIILAIMTLFGQEPSDIVKVWTETADWTFSQKIPPQNIQQDQHYLCTVAAGGHRKVVKPLRTGIRHGHKVVVNRQLCIANAFEQVLEQRTPRFHKTVRGVYDSFGYPIAKHIRSKYTADAIYFIMKPLEWLFLVFLYAVCTRPEDLIAVQYPHSAPPKVI